MSAESCRLIKSMLQIDPKKRITVEELLSHPWLTLGILDSVTFKSTDPSNYDNECISIMAVFFNSEPGKIVKHIKQWKYDYYTATYLLLLNKKKKGSVLKLNLLSTSIFSQLKLSDQPNQTQSLKSVKVDHKLGNQQKGTTAEFFSTLPINYLDSTDDSENMTPIRKKKTFIEPAKSLPSRKRLKRTRSRTLSGTNSPGKC